MKFKIALLIAVMLGSAAFISVKSKPEIMPIREPLAGFPMQLGRWAGQDAPPMGARVLEVLGVDDYIDRIYFNADLFPAGLYIGYYESQRSGDTMHSPLNCLPGAGWNPIKRGRIAIPIDAAGDAPSIEVNRIIIAKGLDKQVVLYWYQSHGRVVASEYWGKVYTVIDALRTNRTDAALVRVICPVAPPAAEKGADTAIKAEAEAEKQARAFVQAIYPFLEHHLPL